jgi:hypothetical protein
VKRTSYEAPQDEVITFGETQQTNHTFSQRGELAKYLHSSVLALKRSWYAETGCKEVPASPGKKILISFQHFLSQTSMCNACIINIGKIKVSLRSLRRKENPQNNVHD